MQIEIIESKENEDGSMDLVIEMDEEAKLFFAKEGLIFTIKKELEKANGEMV